VTNFLRASWLGLALLLGGCHSAVTNETAPSHPSEWEEVHVSYQHRAQKWRWREAQTVDQPPEDAIRATVQVVAVDVPFPQPSGGGETATVTFSVTPGMIPCFPKCKWVVMKYDPYVNPFAEGAAHIIVFLPDGRFWGGTSFQF
jgi:hypothetical protein